MSSDIRDLFPSEARQNDASAVVVGAQFMGSSPPRVWAWLENALSKALAMTLSRLTAFLNCASVMPLSFGPIVDHIVLVHVDATGIP